MVSAGDFRNGITLEIDGQVMQVMEFQHVKPGKGAAFVRTKLRNVIDGGVVERTFRPTEKFPQARIDRIDMQYLYQDGDLYNFMNVETYDQIAINSDIVVASLSEGIEKAFRKHINCYDAFIEGAKEGFTTAVRIIPFLIAILVAIGVFRASGAMDVLMSGIRWLFSSIGFDASFVDALPTALMKPLSGSGARGMMVDTMTSFGPDSFAGRLSCIFQGSTDTTFYILAVYFGSVGIRYTRHAVACGLLADLAGVIAAIAICYLFF